MSGTYPVGWFTRGTEKMNRQPTAKAEYIHFGEDKGKRQVFVTLNLLRNSCYLTSAQARRFGTQLIKAADAIKTPKRKAV